MEKLRIINPETKLIIESDEIQNLSPELHSIISLSLSLYNRALGDAKASDYESAWQHISDAVSLFPYADIPLHFAYELSLELGKYQSTKNIIERLEPFFQEADNKRLVDQVYSELATYNLLVSGIKEDADPDDYPRLVHRLLATLIRKNGTVSGSGRDHFAITTNSKSPPVQNAYKYVVYLSISAIVITVLLLISANSDKTRLSGMLSSQDARIAVLDSTTSATGEALSFQRKLNQFYKAYHLSDYIECAHLLGETPSLIVILTSIDSSIVEKVCARLYTADQYQLVLGIPYKSSFHIHADFQLILSAVGSNRRDHKVSFVQRYPKSYIYTPALLRELYDSEMNEELRMKYAQQLFELVINSGIPDLQFFLTSNIIFELEQSRELSATK
jgi:hypothetical protein